MNEGDSRIEIGRMTPRPYVLLSVATSVDGYIDDTTPERLLLSNAADFDRVDEVRAGSDAILIGATTLRRDNPRLLVNSAERRAERESRGLPPYPLKVTVTASGDLDPELRFWHHGGDKLVYSPDAAVRKLRERLGDLAVVVGLGPELDFAAMLDDLGARGVGRLMVEGGGTIHTQFLTSGLVDEIHLAIAPFFLGDPDAPRFVNPGTFPNGPARRMTLAEARSIGDVALLRYLST
jgi:5-amino-6-(5-phosphoribosylamino)uracil reductase